MPGWIMPKKKSEQPPSWKEKAKIVLGTLNVFDSYLEFPHNLQPDAIARLRLVIQRTREALGATTQAEFDEAIKDL